MLAPKEQYKLTVYLRSSKFSPKDIENLIPRILIRYYTTPIGSSKAYGRFKRIEHNFSVEQSFIIKDNCNRSYKNLSEYLLNLQIERLIAKNESFYLSQLCVVGDGWKIYEKQQFTGFDKVFNAFISLIHEPKGGVALKDKRIMLGGSNKAGIKTVDILGISEENEKDLTCVEPYANYIRENNELRKSKHKKENLLVTSVDLLATWSMEMNKTTIKGAHLVPITLSSYRSIPAQLKGPSKIDVNPLQIVHDCPREVYHDFSKSSVCIVPLTLYIKNSTYQSASFRIESIKMDREQSNKSNNFIWQGITSMNIIGLQYNEQRKILLEACIMNYGVYDLNRFQFVFLRNPSTGEDLNPSQPSANDLALRTYKLEMEQIFVTVNPIERGGENQSKEG